MCIILIPRGEERRGGGNKGRGCVKIGGWERERREGREEGGDS
jgi:hypothetical protein